MMELTKQLVRTVAGAGLAVALMAGTSAQAVTVGVGQSGEPWLGYMNVFELPANGGGYLWGSAWGVADLVATFDDGAGTLTLSPNTIGDADPYWYIGGGAPGNPGNKLMEANLYIEVSDDSLAGQTVTFEGTILSDTFTAAHESYVFIKDFAPDYSSFIETKVAIDGAGAFSIDLATDPGLGRHVQYGFQTVGENVWITDTAPFGSVVIATVPEPASLALIGLGGLAIAGRRKH